MAFWCVALLIGCGDASEQGEPTFSTGGALTEDGEVFFATEVLSFEPGEAAGFGADKMPEVVLGAPRGGGEMQGSLDVVSLGVQGEIALGFGPWDIYDGPGVDFVVFENAFYYGSDRRVFSEPGQVSVSEDGETWVAFDCEADGQGCAGMTPSAMFDPMVEFWMPEMMGGDGFDLADVGLERVRYVRITDRAQGGAPPSAGFDLDAVVGVHGIFAE